MAKRIVLDNGLTVILEPLDSVMSISAGLWIDAGSRDEKVSQYGYAHFVEHMLFKGTEKFSAKDMAKAVDRVGGQHNAATNREYTCYYVNVIADYIDMALEILADMYHHPKFDPLEFEKEKKVILEEIKLTEDSPDEYIHDLFAEKFFGDHSLGHSILGSSENILKTTVDDLHDFYLEHYYNKNVVLSISGAFDCDEILKIINKYFVKQEFSCNLARNVQLNFPPIKEQRINFHKDLEQSHLCLGTNGINRTSEKKWQLYVLNTIFGGSTSSRLFQSIRENAGLCYTVYSFHTSYCDRGVVGIYCGTSSENLDTTLDLINREKDLFCQKGITAEELADAKTLIKGNYALSLESTEFRMAQTARSYMIYGKDIPFEDFKRNIEIVTLDEVNQFVNELFNQQFLTVTIGK